MTNVMHKFLIYLSFSALHVSGFLLAHLQRQVYNFGSGSSLLGMVSAPGRRGGGRDCVGETFIVQFRDILYLRRNDTLHLSCMISRCWM
jgi:hypothetical protein